MKIVLSILINEVIIEKNAYRLENIKENNLIQNHLLSLHYTTATDHLFYQSRDQNHLQIQRDSLVSHSLDCSGNTDWFTCSPQVAGRSENQLGVDR